MEEFREPFVWHGFDVRGALPEGWREKILTTAEGYATERQLTPTSVTSREDAGVSRITVRTVGGRLVGSHLPWLMELYRGYFRDLAQRLVSEPITTAADERIAVNLNVQRGRGMRYECHVDSNPLEGLLYVTSHPEGQGGELVVANTLTARSVEEVDRDCSIVYPQSGHLIFFDARRHAHYVRQLREELAVRVVVAMNFYTPSCAEADRPADLNDHLFGTTTIGSK